MQRARKPRNFLPKPIYPGGPKAMNQFIAGQLTYPEEAFINKIEGTVVLRVTIDFKGMVSGSKVKSSLGYGCDEEAQRVVSLLKFEVDNKIRRGKILFHKTINIHFNLPQPSQKKTAASVHQTQLSYVITRKKKKEAPSSYSYTITY